MVSQCIIVFFFLITMLKTYNLLMCYLSSEITAISRYYWHIAIES